MQEKVGFLILDKPPNIIHHDLTSRIGKIFGVKAGHAGTLDPNVTGVSIIGLGRYTRLLRYFNLPKTYICLAKFKSSPNIDILLSKVGKNLQVPPAQSAVAKKPRYRNLYEVKILEQFGNRVLFRAKVDAGFYMRVLCNQVGAEMEDLRRIAIGDITENMANTIYDVLYGTYKLYSIEDLFDYLGINKLELDYKNYKKAIHGNKIELPKGRYGLFYKSKLVAIVNDGKYEVVIS